MRIWTLGLIVVFLATPAELQCVLHADETKPETPTADNAKAKPNAEEKPDSETKPESKEPQDSKAELQRLLRIGSIEDAVKALETAIEQSPDDIEIQSQRSTLVSRFLQLRKTAEAIDQAEKLNAFQMHRVQDATPEQNISFAMSTLMLRSLYLRENKSAEAAMLVEKTLEALRVAAAKDGSDVYLPTMAQMISATAQGLALAEKYADAEELLKSECADLTKKLDAEPFSERAMQAWVNLMQSRVTNARLAEMETAQTLAEELDNRVLTALQKNASSPALLSLFLSVRSAEVGRLYRDEPKEAQQLLTNTVDLVEASELKDDNAIKAAFGRLKAYEPRIASALLVLEMIGKPAPKLDIEAWAHGEAKSPDDLKGKVVLLDFWAVWCGPCIATFPHLKEWHEEFHEKGLEIVGVTRQYGYEWNEETERPAKATEDVSLEIEQQMLDKFMSHHELHHASIITPKSSTMQKEFGVTGIPHAVLIDRQGNVRMIKVGSGPTNSQALHEMIEKLLAE